MTDDDTGGGPALRTAGRGKRYGHGWGLRDCTLTVPRITPDADLPGTLIHRADSDRHSSVMLRTSPAALAAVVHPDWQAETVGFEELVMAYLQRPAKGASSSNPAQGAQPSGPATKVMSR